MRFLGSLWSVRNLLSKGSLMLTTEAPLLVLFHRRKLFMSKPVNFRRVFQAVNLGFCCSIQDIVLLSRWSRANENLFATTGCPGKINTQLLIHHLGHPQVCACFPQPLYMFLFHVLSNRRLASPLVSLQPVVIGSVTVGSGLSWHRTLPLCVVGGDRKLCFWMTEM